MDSTQEGLEETEYLQARTISNGVWEVMLQRTNREVLFGNAVTTISNVQREAELVLSNLQRLSPDLASLFGVRTPTQIYDTPFKVICESDTGKFPFGKTQPVKQFPRRELLLTTRALRLACRWLASPSAVAF